MTRDIGILETQSHEHILYYLIRISNSDNSSVTVYTTEEIRNRVLNILADLDEAVRWKIKNKDKTAKKFLSIVEKDTKNIDILMLQPLYGNFRTLFNYNRFNPKCKTLFWIFNINTWLYYSPNILSNPQQYLRSFLRHSISKRMDGYIVEYPELRNYIIKQGSNGKPVNWLVPTIYEKGNQKKDDRSNIKIIVPGNITPDRRDYELVINCFKNIAEQDGNLELIIMGRADSNEGLEVLHKFKELQKMGYNVNIKNDWIQFHEYHNNIKKADLIINPLKKEFDKFGVKEVYGRSKGSGLVADALRNATPIILPSHFQINGIMNGGVYYYDTSDEIANIIQKFKNNCQERSETKQNTLNASRNHSLHNQQTRLNSILDNYV